MKTAVIYIILYFFMPLTIVYALEEEEIVEKIRTRDERMHDFIVTYEEKSVHHPTFDDIGKATRYVESLDTTRPMDKERKAKQMIKGSTTVQERNIVFNDHKTFLDFVITSTGNTYMRMQRNNLKTNYVDYTNAIRIYDSIYLILIYFADLTIVRDDNYQLTEMIKISQNIYKLTFESNNGNKSTIKVDTSNDYVPLRIINNKPSSRQVYIFKNYITDDNYKLPSQATVLFYENHPTKNELYLRSQMEIRLKYVKYFDNLDEERITFHVPNGTEVRTSSGGRSNRYVIFNNKNKIVDFNKWAIKYINDWR